MNGTVVMITTSPLSIDVTSTTTDASITNTRLPIVSGNDCTSNIISIVTTPSPTNTRAASTDPLSGVTNPFSTSTSAASIGNIDPVVTTPSSIDTNNTVSDMTTHYQTPPTTPTPILTSILFSTAPILSTFPTTKVHLLLI